jgi:hypothetical protein
MKGIVPRPTTKTHGGKKRARIFGQYAGRRIGTIQVEFDYLPNLGHSKSNRRKSMVTPAILEGTLKPDGTLELDQKPNLAPGRVQVIVQPLSQQISPKRRGLADVIEEIRFIRGKRTSWLQRSGHTVPIEG